MAFSSSIRTAISSVTLILPITIWTVDNLYGFYKVSGSSMEPTFKSGDVVLVRKSDTKFLVGYDKDDKDIKAVRLHESRLGIGGDWISKPPLVTKGDVVIFLSPVNPNETNIKRVIGLGGQHVQPPDRFQRAVLIPKFSVWVEGDCSTNSEDSRNYGPISKKLLVGKAERIVWPPSRWGNIAVNEPSLGRSWWYSDIDA